MVINDLLRKYENHVQDGIIILSYVLNVDKSHIYTYGNREVSTEEENKFRKLMEKRLTGYPLQYILGQWEFMGLDFYLEEGVLVPRQDTEILVEFIIDYIKNMDKDKKIKVLDLGIGSGAISLSIAKYCENAEVTGVDISPQAIKVAELNKKRFNLSNVNFYRGDLFEALKDLDMENYFHIIVSNPPYIARDIIEELESQVRDFEPRLALDGGLDGLDFYRKITPASKKYLRENGLLIYEIGYDQGKVVADIMIKEGFKQVSIKKDLQKHNRVVFGFLID